MATPQPSHYHVCTDVTLAGGRIRLSRRQTIQWTSTCHRQLTGRHNDDDADLMQLLACQPGHQSDAHLLPRGSTSVPHHGNNSCNRISSAHARHLLSSVVLSRSNDPLNNRVVICNKVSPGCRRNDMTTPLMAVAQMLQVRD